MIIYFIFLFIIILVAYMAHKQESHKWIKGLLILIVFGVMILLPGLRDASVGTDTGSYVYFFDVDRRITAQDILTLDFLINKEIGYFLITLVAGLVSDQYWILLMTIALVAVFCHLRSIYNFSFDPVISLFVFIALGFYTFFFNGARQGIACAVYTLSFGALLSGNFLKYAFWVFVACMFHRTAIIALPLFFLFRMKFSLKPFLILVLIATASILTFDALLNISLIISARYALYQKLQATGAQLLTIFFVSLCFFFIAFRSFVMPDDRSKYDTFLNMFLFGSIIYIIVMFSDGYVELTRIASYFQIASIFLWPIIFKGIRWSIPKVLLTGVFVIGHLIYYYVFLNKIGNLTPYQFNPDVLRWL